MAETILAVDDNPVNLMVITTVMAGHGYEIVTAADGPSALKMIEELRPKLVLLDINLPGMDGFEVTRRVRANPAIADTPIVAVTAFALKEYEERARVAGVNAYITKPINALKFASQVLPYIKDRTT